MTVSSAPGTLLYRPRSILERLQWVELFPVTQPVEVELGSGDGSFLLEYARQHPEWNLVGVERLLGRLRKLDRQGRRAGLRNLRLIRLEASYLVRYLLPPASVEALHVYFPDPWPKRKHRKHRLVNAAFVAAAEAVLRPGGTVYLRTDDSDYFAQMQSVFGASAPFDRVETAPALLAIETDFEREFHARGQATLPAAYRRR
jgi:tRNA (guanine-N7-)-methyltransferase